jgi:hypothetical protein
MHTDSVNVILRTWPAFRFLLTPGLRREPCKNETFWHDSDPWRIFSTSSRGLWAFPGALTYIYGIPTSFVVEPACATVTSPQSEV